MAFSFDVGNPINMKNRDSSDRFSADSSNEAQLSTQLKVFKSGISYGQPINLKGFNKAIRRESQGINLFEIQPTNIRTPVGQGHLTTAIQDRRANTFKYTEDQTRRRGNSTNAEQSRKVYVNFKQKKEASRFENN